MINLRIPTRGCGRPQPRRGNVRGLPGLRRFRGFWTGVDGAELLEFALGLPFLLIFVIGIIDFSGAFNLKQKMANAAREGARMAISNSLTDESSGCANASPPCSIQAAENAVANYMTNAGVESSCLSSASASSSGTDSWTYSCKGISLTINRGYWFTYTPATGGTDITVLATQVTLTYPYTWTFGNIIGLLELLHVKNATAILPSTLTTTVVMQNLVTD
ncbi:MAG: pilus assembly protein [Acidobacteria bacterium]|nr:pilus assembly protein [Acidobacteriota bacterium]